MLSEPGVLLVKRSERSERVWSPLLSRNPPLSGNPALFEDLLTSSLAAYECVYFHFLLHCYLIYYLYTYENVKLPYYIKIIFVLILVLLVCNHKWMQSAEASETSEAAYYE